MVQLAAVSAVAVLCAFVVAYLVSSGHPEIALALLLAPLLAAVVLRYPLVAVAVWLLVTPFLLDTAGGAIRLVFWLVHRALPLVVLANILIGARLGFRGPLPRLRWPELAMAGYVALTQLSILHTSDQLTASTYHLYDRVFIPMCLYLIVRYTQPSARDLRRVVPLIVFLLFSQAAIGVLQWAAPGVLPGFWLDRVGLRTVGSLNHPNVYGTTMLFAGLLLLHAGMSREPGDRQWRLLCLFPVSLVLVFLTYSRASWLAGLLVVVALFPFYPRFITKLVVVSVVLCTVLLASGRIDQQVQMAQNRFRSESSEESALSRLPIVAASLRMFQARPLMGWGYENFNKYDQQFQSAVGGLVVPEKDHSSHNLYLTLLAEQGLPGLLSFMFPALWWFVATGRGWRSMPTEGLVSRRLVACLWLVLATHVVVNNYSNMQVTFGLGIWWLTLGMIASLVTRFAEQADERSVDGWSFAVGDPSVPQQLDPLGRS
jgi:O-antigen ligase